MFQYASQLKEITMSNVALFNSSNVPAFARKAELSDIAKALGGNAAASGKRVSIKGGVFRLLAGGKEIAAIDERFLDVVIVKAAPKVARTFYMSKYDPEAAAASPDCFSNDGDKPDSKSKMPQSTSCNGCKQNIAGSGNGQSRACRYQQRLAVVLENAIDGDVMQLALPATSIFGKSEGDNHPLQAYASWLLAQSVDPAMVVTRMKFDTKAEAPKLYFKAMRWLTQEEFETATERGLTPEASRAVVLNVTAQDTAPLSLGGNKPKAAPVIEEEEEEAPAPAPVKAKAKPKVEEPKVEEPKAEPEEDIAPVVRKAEAEKPNSVPAKKSLADMVSEWDDE
jgi:hypothetical protein